MTIRHVAFVLVGLPAIVLLALLVPMFFGPPHDIRAALQNNSWTRGSAPVRAKATDSALITEIHIYDRNGVRRVVDPVGEIEVIEPATITVFADTNIASGGSAPVQVTVGGKPAIVGKPFEIKDVGGVMPVKAQLVDKSGRPYGASDSDQELSVYHFPQKAAKLLVESVEFVRSTDGVTGMKASLHLIPIGFSVDEMTDPLFSGILSLQRSRIQGSQVEQFHRDQPRHIRFRTCDGELPDSVTLHDDYVNISLDIDWSDRPVPRIPKTVKFLGRAVSHTGEGFEYRTPSTPLEVRDNTFNEKEASISSTH